MLSPKLPCDFMYAKHCCRSQPCVDACACYDCRFGLSSLRSSSNIFFTNGIYDPFTACGPTVNISDTITATIYGRGICKLFQETCCLWHPCLMPDANYACNRNVQAVNTMCLQCTSICILQSMEVVWHTACTASKARCCLVYCTHIKYADLGVPAEGPHAFDVESTKPEDPASAVQARAQGLQYIQTWVNQYNAQKALIPMSNPSDLFNLAFDVGGYTSAWSNTLPGSNTNNTDAILSGTAAIYNSSV